MKEAYDLMDRLLRSSMRRKVWKREELRELILKSVLEMQQELLQSTSAPTTPITIKGSSDAISVGTVGQREDLRTSEEWSKVCVFNVLDPDGWDRKNFDYSWKQELITRKEFEERLTLSTVEIKKQYIIEGEPNYYRLADNIWSDLR